MQYEPIKNSLGRFIGDSHLMRKILYFLIDLLLLRTWHVKKALRNIAVNLPAGALILDAGSGLGQYSWRMSRMKDKWKIKGIDINSLQVEECTRFFGKTGLSDRVTFQSGDLTKLTDENSYNLILSVDVMEHIEDDLLVFSNFYKALKAGGTLLISTPSDKGGSDVHDDSEESFIDEHVRDGYSIGDITGKLKMAGFSTVEAHFTYGKPGNFSWRISMKYPVKMLNISYLFFIILPFYYIILFPVAMILNFLDLRIKHNSGTGLLVTARK